MKLNPLSALSDLLGKLVVEHGSAVITEKNLVFLRDQLAAAEKEIIRLTMENGDLKLKIDDLRNIIQDCEKINKQLKNELKKHNIPPTSASSEPCPDDYHAKRKRLI